MNQSSTSTSVKVVDIKRTSTATSAGSRISSPLHQPTLIKSEDFLIRQHKQKSTKDKSSITSWRLRNLLPQRPSGGNNSQLCKRPSPTSKSPRKTDQSMVILTKTNLAVTLLEIAAKM